jgi:hypothetical protein
VQQKIKGGYSKNKGMESSRGPGLLHFLIKQILKKGLGDQGARQMLSYLTEASSLEEETGT